MSAWKRLLRVVELIAGLDILVALAVIILILEGDVSVRSTQPVVMAGFTLMFPLLAVAILVQGEYMQLRRAGDPWWYRKWISFAELKRSLQWCPRPLLFITLVLAALGFAGLVWVGDAQWRSGEEFTEHHALVFSLAILGFCSVTVPVLASASRMPGRFSDHFTAADVRS
jgi:hypothetical protein